MKKLIPGLAIIAILAITSCSKNSNSSSALSNAWTFKSNSYSLVTCTSTGSTLVASSATGTNLSTYGTIQIQFPGSSLPTSGGPYTVVSTVPGSNQVVINATTGGTSPTDYVSTGNGSNQTVTVSVSNGKVTVAGSNIEMLNAGGGSDSSALNFSVTQQ